MQGKNRSRRGTGHLYQKDDRWYGQWYVRGARVKRSLGPVRQPSASDGLTKRQAQARMLDAMTATDSAPAPLTERLTVEEVGKRRIRELARKGRKQDTTLANYESEIRCHFVPTSDRRRSLRSRKTTSHPSSTRASTTCLSKRCATSTCT